MKRWGQNTIWLYLLAFTGFLQACFLDSYGTAQSTSSSGSGGSSTSSGGFGGVGGVGEGGGGNTTVSSSGGGGFGGFGGNTSSSGGGGSGGMTSSGGGGQGGSTSSSGGGGSGPTCGDNSKEADEVCDGTDLDNQDCGTVPGGYTSGMLACLPDCSGFNTAACVSPPPTCPAGTTNGTVDTITASGAIETGFLLRFADGVEVYSTTVPSNQTFTGEDLPGQLALYGKEGIQFDLQNGTDPVSMSFYEVDDFSTLPSPQCDGIALKSQACLSLVAKSFRCQFAPYNEAFNCPPDVSFVEPVESPSDFYQDLSAGYHLLVVDLICP